MSERYQFNGKAYRRLTKGTFKQVLDVLERFDPRTSPKGFDEGWSSGRSMRFMRGERSPPVAGKEVPWTKAGKE